ncbi:DUF4397 domain-containing protein [Arcticibacter sp.]|jgi:hypothetical protein|uniref:DUF4397 domain-containing protein n=1 Tax=Arcticibacter sp. TaxID=1872630 RepID=UPI00388D2091
MKLFDLLPKKNRFMSMGLTLLASATLLSSCLKNDSDDYQGPISAVSFVHAAASQPSVEVFVDGRPFFNSAVLYGEYSPYYTAGSGNHLFQTAIGGTNQKLSDKTYALEEGKYHTIFFANKVESDSLETVVTVDDRTAPATGKVKVRFVQLSPTNEEYDLYLQGGRLLSDAKAYKESSEFTEIDPAKYKFAVRLAGAAEDKVVTAEVDAAAGKFYTVVLAGKASIPAGTTGALKAFVLVQ